MAPGFGERRPSHIEEDLWQPQHVLIICSYNACAFFLFLREKTFSPDIWAAGVAS